MHKCVAVAVVYYSVQYEVYPLADCAALRCAAGRRDRVCVTASQAPLLVHSASARDLIAHIRVRVRIGDCARARRAIIPQRCRSLQEFGSPLQNARNSIPPPPLIVMMCSARTLSLLLRLVTRLPIDLEIDAIPVAV